MSLSWLKWIPGGNKLLGGILRSLSHTVVSLVPHQLVSEHIMTSDGYYICTINNPIYELNISNSNVNRHITREHHLQPSSETPNKKITSCKFYFLFFDGFCHTSTWIGHRYTCAPSSGTPSHLPSYHILLGCPRALALLALLHALNLHWPSILHTVIYMFQCYSLKSSHPHLLPHSPKVCSLHLCAFCCPAYRIVITVFLNSMYMH